MDLARPDAGEEQGNHRFAAVLSPYRSLSPVGFVILMAAVSWVSFLAGLFFYLSGAWPVAGFLGLDVVLLYVAFKLNYRAARARELVVLTDEALSVTRVSAGGRRATWVFNPYWAQVRLEGDAVEDRTTLTLASHGRELVIGRFLSNSERQTLAHALQAALQQARIAPGH